MISASPRRLSVFKRVVDCGGFNLAALDLGIAQPSVGAHIKALETQVGQPLFQRARGTRPQLTKAGEALYAYAVEVLQKSQAASQTLAEIRSSAGQEIIIATHRDVAPHFLPSWLTAFRARYPKVHVITRIGTIDEVLAQVRARAAHLGLFLASGPVSGLQTEVIDRVPLVLVVSPGHPLAGRKALSAATIKQHPFVTGISGSRFNQMTDAALKEIGINSYEVAMELEESAATKEMVRRGLAVTCLPYCSVAAELAAGTLTELTPAKPLQQVELRCGYAGPLSENARNLLTVLRAGTAQH
ncbi:MAG TPA: LysR family transcriptional regulator [Bradyrhizobium sp.]|nr:LysR family transcriptional regulator [Bradyrhizobium sp.]